MLFLSNASIVYTHMMLQAWELGIGSCWTGAFSPAAVSEAFGIPGNEHPVAILPLAPPEGCQPSDRHLSYRDCSEWIKKLNMNYRRIIPLVMSILSLLGLSSCSAAYKSLSAAKFSKLIQGDVQILDARTAGEFAEGHIEGAVLADVNMDNFRDVALSKISKDSPVAVYCRSGRRSLTACDILSRDGYKVYNLKTGIIGWQEAGLPVVKDEPVRPKPMCGAYTQQRDLTPEELNLFRHTLKDDRYTPVSVATQVVSGINYRFFCKGPDGDVVVTIYKPLHDAPRVTEMSK